jgi:hypothetical protein
MILCCFANPHNESLSREFFNHQATHFVRGNSGVLLPICEICHEYHGVKPALQEMTNELIDLYEIQFIHVA